MEPSPAVDDPFLSESLQSTLVELVDIPSESGSERAIADALQQQLEALDELEVQRIDDNLVVRLPHPGNRPQVLLCGHLDTVPAQNNLPARVEGDKVHGLGTSDLKAGLAVFLQLLRGFDFQRRACDPVFVFYTCEEVAFAQSGLVELGSRLPDLRKASFAICVEPTSNHVELGCNGTLHAEVTVSGKSAHSARPWLGHNAVHAALPVLARFAAVPQRSVTFPEYDLRYEEVLSVTTIEGGLARNMIPPRVRFNANFRFAPDRTSDQACQQIVDLVGDEGSVSFQDISPSGAVPEANPHGDQLIALSGRRPRAKQAWTDVGRFTEWGIPSVSFGPGIPEQAHQQGEYASIHAMVESHGIFTRFLLGEGFPV